MQMIIYCSGELKTEVQLDREDQSIYMIVVQATDGNGKVRSYELVSNHLKYF